MILSFRKKQAVKTDDKKPTIKAEENRQKIRDYLTANGESQTADIAKAINLSATRTKEILYEMKDIEIMGGNRNRTYKLK